MFRPIFWIAQKELRQLFRDRALLRVVLVVPMIQLFVFGYAANTDLKNVRVSVLDEDRSEGSRRLVDAYYASDVFVPGPAAGAPRDLDRFLLEGKTDAALWIPRGFSEDLARGDPASVAVTVDGVNGNVAGRVMGYATAIVRQESLARLEKVALAHPGLAARTHRVDADSRFYYNPELRSRHYMVPGIVVLIITIVSAMLTGIAVVREREIGTLEQLMVSPLTSGQIIAGKTIPIVVLAFLELAFATTVAVLWFRLPFEGSVLLLAGCAMAYLLVTLGVGLLVSTVSATQQQAMFTLWFFLVFGILMSGFFYPIENMAREVQWLTYLNPFRYMMSMVRGIFLQGATLPDVASDLVPLAAIGVVTFTGAVLRFQKRFT
ncbi:MAG: ABC transporter permease [Candidatus Eisenbacteria sp.]|nr:ABC transporter permease [Candidatus Eisenbacteria bacterium]